MGLPVPAVVVCACFVSLAPSNLGLPCLRLFPPSVLCFLSSPPPLSLAFWLSFASPPPRPFCSFPCSVLFPCGPLCFCFRSVFLSALISCPCFLPPPPPLFRCLLASFMFFSLPPLVFSACFFCGGLLPRACVVFFLLRLQCCVRAVPFGGLCSLVVVRLVVVVVLPSPWLRHLGRLWSGSRPVSFPCRSLA